MKERLTLKELALDIKSSIINGMNLDIENYIEELSRNSHFNIYEIKDLYNEIFMVCNVEINKEEKRRRWVECEDNLILLYLSLNNSKKSKENKPAKQVMYDLGDILINRSGDSVSFRYYNQICKDKTGKKKPKYKRQTEAKPEVQAKTVETQHKEESETAQQHVKPEDLQQLHLQQLEQQQKLELEQQLEPQLEDELLDVQPTEIVKGTFKSESKGENLLDVLAELIDNVELADVDISPIIIGMRDLSRKAVMKTENIREMKQLERELEDEKEENKLLKIELDQFNKDLESLRSEIKGFNELDGKEQVRHFREYNENVRYIVDKFGNVNAIIK